MTTQHCPNCTDTDVRVDHAFHPADEAVYCERCEWEGCVSDLVTAPDTLTPCGLNADWSVSAWRINVPLVSGPAPMCDGGTYLLDNEDGTFSIVRRWLNEADYIHEYEVEGMVPHPDRYQVADHGAEYNVNDTILTIATFATFADAINGAVAMTKED
jgi:hypothetical protein